MMNNKMGPLPYPANEMYYKKGQPGFEGWPDDSCILGLSAEEDFLTRINTIPPQTKNLYTYYAAGSIPVLEQLVAMDLHHNLENLTIGFEHGNSNYNYQNYAELSAFLSTIQFPQLKKLKYGVDNLIVNEDKYFPQLGDLTYMLQNMTALETLGLYGSFTLQQPLSLPALKNIEVSGYWVTDAANGYIDNTTFNNLLHSHFPAINDVLIDLELYYDRPEKQIYSIGHDTFLHRSGPLVYVEIAGDFEAGTRQRLEKILAPKTEKLFLDEVT